MQGYSDPSKWQQVSGKKRPHWGILTLDDLDKTKWKNSHLVTQLRAQYQAARRLGKDKPNHKSEDYSI